MNSADKSIVRVARVVVVVAHIIVGVGVALNAERQAAEAVSVERLLRGLPVSPISDYPSVSDLCHIGLVVGLCAAMLAFMRLRGFNLWLCAGSTAILVVSTPYELQTSASSIIGAMTWTTLGFALRSALGGAVAVGGVFVASCIHSAPRER